MNRKLCSGIIFIVLLSISLSGCIFDDIFSSGTTFFIESWEIADDEGFPAVHLNFKSNGKIHLKTYRSNSEKVDEEYFYGSENGTLDIGSYRKVISSEEITLKIYDKSNELIKKKIFTFSGPNLNLISCNPMVWEKEDELSLLGMELNIVNTGDVPIYPYNAQIDYDNKIYTSYILPCTVLPDSYSTTSFFVYIKNIEKGKHFNLTLKDIDGNVLTKEKITFSSMITLDTTSYNQALDNKLNFPVLDFLYDHYDNLKLYVNDYAAFVFDRYDDQFIGLLVDRIVSTLDFGEDEYNSMTDTQKINYFADFVQSLEYREDLCEGGEVDDPQYPADTLFNNQGLGGGDCEDKAILIASILDNLNYNVSLIRIPNHMAVGVNLSKDALPNSEFYAKGYYFLDTSANMDLGFIHRDYKNPDDLDIYPINERPFIHHTWRDNCSTIYTHSNGKKTLKVISYIENLGHVKADNLELKGVFYIKDEGLVIKEETDDLPSINPYSKIKTIISVDIPKGVQCLFDTRIYLNGEKVSTQTSQDEFNK